MVTILTLTFYFVGFLSSALGQSCSTFDNCEGCYSMSGCQWCLESGSYSCISESLNEPCPGANTNEAIVCESGDVQSQVSISRAIVQLQPGHNTTFEFSCKRPSDPLLDFYMIMDLSFSLIDDLNTIKSISSDIASSLQNLTSNIAIGFSKFVDKIVYPYTPEYILELPFTFIGEKSACRNNLCVAPFSYTHLLNLTNNTDGFISVLNGLEISTNADNPEGTLDAISQAVLCKDLVGWRDGSIKILFVVTDATVHIAGDGRFAGIIKQSPKECKTVYDHKTDSFTYLDNAKYDYPSLGEIRDLLFNYSVIPVFAIVENIRSYYEEISVILDRAGPQIVTLQYDSANIIEAIKSSIENVFSNVELKYVSNSENVFKIEVTAICPDGAITSSNGQSCGNVTAEQTVTFRVDVTLNQCTEDLRSGSSKVTQINIPGYGKFDLDIRGSCS